MMCLFPENWISRKSLQKRLSRACFLSTFFGDLFTADNSFQISWPTEVTSPRTNFFGVVAWFKSCVGNTILWCNNYVYKYITISTVLPYYLQSRFTLWKQSIIYCDDIWYMYHVSPSFQTCEILISLSLSPSLYFYINSTEIWHL